MHLIGMMQGRLLPMVDGRIQAFPRVRWEEEFALLRELGYDAIELTIEDASWDVHPLRTGSGKLRLRELSSEFGIHLAGICGDNFMENPIVSDDESVRQRGVMQLVDLLEQGAALGLPMVEVPMMGKNTLKTPNSRARFDAAMEQALPRAERLCIDIVLESDLAPRDLADFMNQFAHSRLGINYDMGNSTWFGFDPDEELPAYHRHVRNVHVKDCTVRDYSVPLGKGETRFDDVFGMLSKFGYQGDFVLQAARQDDNVAAGRDYLGFTRKLLNAHWPEMSAIIQE